MAPRRQRVVELCYGPGVSATERLVLSSKAGPFHSGKQDEPSRELAYPGMSPALSAPGEHTFQFGHAHQHGFDDLIDARHQFFRAEYGSYQHAQR